MQNAAPFASLYDAQLRERLGGSATGIMSPGKLPPQPADIGYCDVVRPGGHCLVESEPGAVEL